MTTMVIPYVAFKSQRIEKIISEEAGSSAHVGSSKIITRGRNAKIAAMATFCFCPPESVSISRYFKSKIPTARKASSIRE